jgi:hypothetical protein
MAWFFAYGKPKFVLAAVAVNWLLNRKPAAPAPTAAPQPLPPRDISKEDAEVLLRGFYREHPELARRRAKLQMDVELAEQGLAEARQAAAQVHARMVCLIEERVRLLKEKLEQQGEVNQDDVEIVRFAEQMYAEAASNPEHAMNKLVRLLAKLDEKHVNP